MFIHVIKTIIGIIIVSALLYSCVEIDAADSTEHYIGTVKTIVGVTPPHNSGWAPPNTGAAVVILTDGRSIVISSGWHRVSIGSKVYRCLGGYYSAR